MELEWGGREDEGQEVHTFMLDRAVLGGGENDDDMLEPNSGGREMLMDFANNLATIVSASVRNRRA